MRIRRLAMPAGLAVAALSCAPGLAQDAGTADQAATLPPIVVQQPKTATPATLKAKTAKVTAPVAAANGGGAKGKAKSSGGATAAAGGGSGVAGVVVGEDLGTGSASSSSVFSLGAIDLMGGTVVSSDQSWKFAKPTLDQAMKLAPGVSDANSGGSRNERLIYVQGFNRWQVPLSIDGVRVYLPADNRLDFARFLTSGISEVQIAEGYASVLNGPGGLGGAINLVTKRPSKAMEGEVDTAVNFGGDGRYEGFLTSATAAAKTKGVYILASGSWDKSEGWTLSDDFEPTKVQPAGQRLHSDTNDWSANAKIALTPNATDEYSLNYITTHGAKGAPLAVNATPTAAGSTARFWDWPIWNTQSVYSLTSTRLGSSAYVNTKAYYNTFDNVLAIYDDIDLTRQLTNGASTSTYADIAYGGSVDAGIDLATWDTLKGAFHYRRDIHNEHNELYTVASCPAGNPPPCNEPTQTDIEDTYSAALENTLHPLHNVDLVTGASYDWTDMMQAQDWQKTRPAGSPYPAGLFDYPIEDNEAFNSQGALVYHYSADGKLFASVSDRTRFPTIFERFSARFGTAISNPGLAPERAINYELGWADNIGPGTYAASVFYSDVSDFIQSVQVNTGTVAKPVYKSQFQNVGDGYFSGVKASAEVALSKQLSVGGNVTVEHRVMTVPGIPTFALTDVPEAKGIAYLSWRPIDGLTLTPNVEWATDRWSTNATTTSSQATYYLQTGAYTLANLSADYDVASGVTVTANVHNIFDQNYSLTDAFPEPGRSFTAGVKAKF